MCALVRLCVFVFVGLPLCVFVCGCVFVCVCVSLCDWVRGVHVCASPSVDLHFPDIECAQSFPES